MDVFPEVWAKIVENYAAEAPKLVEYVRTEWVESSCKEEVFDCFINTTVRHFGHKSTSTNEGAHAILKKYLQDRTGNLLTVISAAHTKIQSEIHEIQGVIAKDYNRKPEYLRRLNIFIMSLVR